MKERFIDRDYSPRIKAIIDQAVLIAEEYRAKGFQMTLRQLYYQFVARGMLENKVNEYKRLGDILNNARQSGDFDWSLMEDRTRNVQHPNAWGSPQEILNAVADQYQENPWLEQDWAPEVWVEKDALIGVIEPVCERMRVPYFACRGNVSQSESYAAGKRLLKAHRNGRTPIIFHLGDHDPNGLDMTRDNRDRLSMFSGLDVEVRRLALNMDQVELYNPPPNPAKETDSRYARYVEEYGDESWELDALSPEIIDGLIQDALDGILDHDAWASSMRDEERAKRGLQLAAEHWDDVESRLLDEDGGA